MRKLFIRTLAASWLVILSADAGAFDIVQLTDNSATDLGADVSGSKVVWSGNEDGDQEIYLWDGVTTTQVTNNSNIFMTTIPGPTRVPSMSFGGLALLAGLVLGIVAWARRGR